MEYAHVTNIPNTPLAIRVGGVKMTVTINRYSNDMPNYTKLFNSIVTSTIWTEDDKTRILWITMLAMSDQNGEVHASIPGLARIAGIDIQSTEKAIEAFLSPDPYSRTPDNEGRRIAKIDGGWELLNHAKYRAMASKEDSKAATAARVKRHRERKAEMERNATVTPCNVSVTVGRDIAEAEANTKAERRKEREDTPTPQGGFELDVSESKKPDPDQIAVGKLLGRRESTKWTSEEIKLLKAIKPIHPDDLAMMKRFYGADIPKESDYRRTTIERLLKHWNGELDKARIYTATKP